MHSYLKTIGFRKIRTNSEMKEYIHQITEHPDREEVVQIDENSITMFTKYVSENMGVAVCGEYEENGDFHTEYYFPFVDSDIPSLVNTGTIRKQGALQAYSVLTEDYRFGVSLIFYLTNFMELAAAGNLRVWSGASATICLSALASEARILMPVQKSEEDREKEKVASSKRTKMIEAAKDGNQAAMDDLTYEEMTLYNQLNQRVKKEDLYSIIDTFFMPSVVECDQYAFMGEIMEVKNWTNQITGEMGYHMLVNCNQMQFSVTVHKDDLLGEPEVGRRVKGQIWMQGTMKF